MPGTAPHGCPRGAGIAGGWVLQSLNRKNQNGVMGAAAHPGGRRAVGADGKRGPWEAAWL